MRAVTIPGSVPGSATPLQLPGMRKLEITICDFKLGRPASSGTLRFYGTRGGDALQCVAEQSRDSSQHRDHAHLRTAASEDWRLLPEWYISALLWHRSMSGARRHVKIEPVDFGSACRLHYYRHPSRRRPPTRWPQFPRETGFSFYGQNLFPHRRRTVRRPLNSFTCGANARSNLPTGNDAFPPFHQTASNTAPPAPP